MSIELDKATRTLAIASIERYFKEHMDEPIGNLQAGALLSFFLDEVGPAIYNRAVLAAQAHIQVRVADLDIDVHEDEFGFWPKQARTGRKA